MSELRIDDDSPRHPGVNFPPPLLFVLPLGAGVLLHQWLPLHLISARWRVVGVIVGWLLIGVWAALSGWAMVTFSRQRTPIMPNRPATRLVTWGPYRLSRNPMYLALSALYLGVSVLVNTIWSVFFFPVVLALLYFLVIRREERYLSGSFRNEYDSYCASVRRWL